VYQTELKYRVLYAHTDKLGVVYYGKYFEYFEAGRSDMLRKLGYPYKIFHYICLLLTLKLCCLSTVIIELQEHFLVIFMVARIIAHFMMIMITVAISHIFS